ncbi:hypothetical protein OSB04_002263 [Centaurea solstitialis]|uniref:AB hydrolase-1 domain-containing protein n=1 Tax=Centaurea solstitialis TaxID=347529 RepID=A0AA38WM71_9ASTR|nr:hypothetical protein OSB04_002263 [Centaurea solstitialis]
MDKIVHKFVQVNGVKLHLAEIGTESSPAVVFLHGFPEIWYSWRHQMIAVAGAGYRAIAPDCRGYGLSDPPPETEKFGFPDIVDDLLAILDHLGIDKGFRVAIFLLGINWGWDSAMEMKITIDMLVDAMELVISNTSFPIHKGGGKPAKDLWGCGGIYHPSKISIITKDAGTRPAYLFALLHPTRVTSVISLGIPHTPFGPPNFLKELPEGFYINRWREPGRAEADFGRLDAKTVVRNIYILFSRTEIPIASEGQEIMDIVEPSTPLPPWFTEEDLSAYGALYEKSGFLNPLKVPYRSLDEEYNIVDPVIKNPMLLIVGEKDYFVKFPGVEDVIKSGMVKHFASNLEVEWIPEGSHFVQEQFPDQVNSLILAFLRKHC